MGHFALVMTVAAVVTLFLFAEIAAAVLPIFIVIVMVPPPERHGLAELLAVTDNSRKLRLWPALVVAVAARRRERQRSHK
jgi:putative exporter of polyketide antibiotics